MLGFAHGDLEDLATMFWLSVIALLNGKTLEASGLLTPGHLVHTSTVCRWVQVPSCPRKPAMFRPIQGFRLGLDHCRNPFDQHADIVGQHHLFIYLTGRGAYSYIFPPTAESDILDAAAHCIPMGYTQIWVLEWINAVRPTLGKPPRPSQRRAAQQLRLDRMQEGHTYVLIGENAQCFGGTERLPWALGASRWLAAERAMRIAVGLLTANITWH
jgi:hypothetical protein